MNYQRIHDAIIDRARNRTLLGYRERHHVIPRCLGGTDKSENLVELTAREHFVVHKLLVELYPTETKLIYAYWMMSRNISNSKYSRDYLVSARDYEHARRLFSEASSKHQRGKTLTEEHKEALSIAAKTRKTRTPIKHSEETKQKLSSLWKGTTRSLEDRQKISNGQLGKKRKIVTCPHCGKTGGNNGMTHWHFDNCKFKIKL
jgi:hypothetical protein